MRATGVTVASEFYSSVTDDVTELIEHKFDERIPGVEDIQDVVEMMLAERGLFEVAKAYILYRKEREDVRRHKQDELLEKIDRREIKVVKRSGEMVEFNIGEIEKAITNCCIGLEGSIDVIGILRDTKLGLYDGIKTSVINQAVIMAIRARIERDPVYSTLAARFLFNDLYKAVLGMDEFADGFADAHRAGFATKIKASVDAGRLDPHLLEFDLARLGAELRPERDTLFTYLGAQVLYDRYFLKNLQQEILETPQYFWMRIAMGLAMNEPEEREDWALKFYDVISSLHYVPSTPTLFHSGTNHPQMSSCYLTTVKDDLSHILKCVGDNAQLSKWSGGLGNDWTNIRGTGAQIKSTNVGSQGVVPFLKIVDATTAAINRSGKRRGATCVYLECWHYDFEDFLELRKNTGDERRRTHDTNTASWIPDLFMKRVLEDGTWTLFSPDETPDLHDLYGRAFELRYEEYERMADAGQIRLFRKLRAVDLWRRMITMLYETGHPWITFKDPCNVRSPQDHVGVVHSSNLCTEITLNTSHDETAVCNLGSVNLSRHVDDGKLNHDRLKYTIKMAVRMLDNVIDLNFYPTEESRRANLRHRPIGLGVMGLQDALYMLNLPFDSDDAVAFSDQLAGVHLLPRDSFIGRIGRGEGRVRVVRRLEVGPWPLPRRHARSTRERARPGDGRRAALVDGLDAGARACEEARHAQLQHDGDRAHGDHRQHRRVRAVDRAHLQEHVREVELQRRIHHHQSFPGERLEGTRPVGRRHDGEGQVLRRQCPGHPGDPGRGACQVQRSVRDRPDLDRDPRRLSRQVDRPEPVGQHLHDQHLRQADFRGIHAGVEDGPEDDVLPAHAGSVVDREVDARFEEQEVHNRRRSRGPRDRARNTGHEGVLARRPDLRGVSVVEA